MYVTSHECRCFRNITQLVFEPCEQVNVICGSNGQGKTNLLESIYLLTGAKSFRTGKDAALIKNGEAAAFIDTEFFSERREQTISIKISEKGRTASLNKGSEAKASALAGKFCCVIFSPEHLALVKGSPDMRRRFIDTALCQISSAYLANLRRYTKILQQRNSLLKDSSYVSAAFEMLEVYDMQFAQAAEAITKQRQAFIKELLPAAIGNYEAISNKKETLNFSYCSTLYGDDAPQFDAAIDLLRSNRAAEQKCGYTLAGPHRDDIDIFLDGEDSKQFASQGQQRCIVLSLKLAEAQLMESKLGQRPVLLLDDVLSELDANRQDYLIDSIKDTQAVISCCEPELVLRNTKAQVFRMENGRLV